MIRTVTSIKRKANKEAENNMEPNKRKVLKTEEKEE